MNQNNELNDEIDLKDLLLTLWHGKIYIILFSIISVFFGSLYLQSVERQYTVEYNLKPVGGTEKTVPLSGLGGIAQMAGIQLPSISSDDFIIFKELMTSVEVSEIIFDNEKMIKDIFRSEWNESLNDYSEQPKNKIQIIASSVKKLLTGKNEIPYYPPSPIRLASIINKTIKINEDKNTGFLSITSESSKPELMLSLIIQVTNASDKIVRQRYVDFSTEPLAFYKEKIRTSRSREHREALAELIAKEEQKLMFASRGRYFVAEPYINPKISLYPTAPNSKLILMFSLVIGLFIAIALILIRASNNES
jgi:uncharacterized protein involved in exopolysaccharide biosynthesis